jgi:catechol 2,3-dioxygenase-like lactoylglutathione lyase family enzyme
MLDRVSITVSDIDAAERFYDAIMRVLGIVIGRRGNWATISDPVRSPAQRIFGDAQFRALSSACPFSFR